MDKKVKPFFDELLERYPALGLCLPDITASFEALLLCAQKDGTILVCGNGGSAADSDHIVGELMKGFLLKRPLPPADREKLAAEPELAACLQRGIRAVSLTGHNALSTAFGNDVNPDFTFAQQTCVYLRRGDVLLGLSTSGKARNVVNAVKTANAFGGVTIGMTGASGGELAGLCAHCIRVPETATYKVQELHLPVYHALCAALEAVLFG